MVKLSFVRRFLKKLSKIKDESLREQIDKQIEKIADNPLIGKPMRYDRKGTRELYIGAYILGLIDWHMPILLMKKPYYF